MVPLLCGAAVELGRRLHGRRAVQVVVARVVAAHSRHGRVRAGAAGVSWVSLADSPTSAIAGFAVATFGVEMTISPSWAFCLDIGGKNSGTISAAMNMAGNLGGFASTNAFPLLRGLTGSAATYFHAAALLNILSMFCWVAMKPPARAPMTKSSG